MSKIKITEMAPVSWKSVEQKWGCNLNSENCSVLDNVSDCPEIVKLLESLQREIEHKTIIAKQAARIEELEKLLLKK